MRFRLALIAVLALPASAHAAASTPNLIQDPGAERGGVGWRFDDGFFAAQYGAPGLPGADISATFEGGARFFMGGSSATIATATQVIDVRPAASQIDSTGVNLALSGRIGGLNDENDYSEVKAVFLPESGQALLGSEVKIGPVTPEERGHQTAFVQRSATGQVPLGTRFIVLTITANRVEGTSNDGYADNLSLVLNGASFTPTFVSTQATAVSAKGKGRKVTGKVTAAGPCAAGRRVVVKRGAKVLGSGKSGADGSYSVKTKKHKKAKLTVSVSQRTVDDTICTAATTSVPGRH